MTITSILGKARMIAIVGGVGASKLAARLVTVHILSGEAMEAKF